MALRCMHRSCANSSYQMLSQPLCSWKLIAMSVLTSGSCQLMIVASAKRGGEVGKRGLSRRLTQDWNPFALTLPIRPAFAAPPERWYISSLLILCTSNALPSPSSLMTTKPCASACCDDRVVQSQPHARGASSRTQQTCTNNSFVCMLPCRGLRCGLCVALPWPWRPPPSTIGLLL